MKIQVQISLVGQSTWTNPMWVWRKAGAGGGGGEREGARSQTTSCGFSIAESSRWTIPDNPRPWKVENWLCHYLGRFAFYHLVLPNDSQGTGIILRYFCILLHRLWVSIANMCSLFWPKVFPWTWTMYMPPLQRINLFNNLFRLLWWLQTLATLQTLRL